MLIVSEIRLDRVCMCRLVGGGEGGGMRIIVLLLLLGLLLQLLDVWDIGGSIKLNKGKNTF